MSAPQFTRARSADAKQIRETAILESASRLATAHGVRNVTLTDIAAEVGMHKSTMLRYFETREEIFLRLSAAGWARWSTTAEQRLDDSSLQGLAGLEARVEAVAQTLAESLVAEPLFCDLLAHVPLNLERGVSFDAVRRYKLGTRTGVRSVAGAIGRVVDVSDRQAQDTVAVATSLAGAFWQMAAPGTELRRYYEETPELAHSIVDVAPRLTGVLTALLRGYLAAP